MDLDYRKKSSELVYDLINRDNPNLPVPVSPDNCRLGTPVTISEGFRNTRIAVMALDGGYYMGTANVTYRRLSFYDLFRQGYPVIDDYLMPADYGPSGAAWVSMAAALRWINNKYGTGLTVAEDTDRTQVSNGVQKNAIWNFPAANPAWVGAGYWDRRAAKKPVSEQIPDAATSIATFVAGQPSGGAPTNIADFASYQVDFSKFKDLLATFTTLQVLPQTQAMAEVIKYLSIVYGRELALEKLSSELNGMSGARIIRYTLPNVNVPEANSTDYNNVAIIQPAAAGSWFVGRFLLHYKT